MAPIRASPHSYNEKGFDKVEDKLEFQDLKVIELYKEDANGWKYRGEGATNIVLVYHGYRPSFIGRVLRIPKVSEVNGRTHIQSKKDSKMMLSKDEIKLWKEWPNMSLANTLATMTHLYTYEVMQPLLGKDHVDGGLLVFLTAGFLKVVHEDIFTKEAQWRENDAKIETTGCIALLIADHSSFHTLAEKVKGLPQTITLVLKPKWGCLPTSPIISELNNVKLHVSRFAMHQHLKLQQGKIKNISKYSPLDLFSSNIERIHKALITLFETPQNNLRIFLKGEEIFGGLGNNEETMTLEEKLARVSIAPKGERLLSFQRVVASALYESKVLDQLLSVQKLDVYDIEGAILAYNKFLGMIDDVDDNIEEGLEALPDLNCDATSNNVSKSIVPHDTFVDNIALEEDEEEGREMKREGTWIKTLSWEESRSIVRDFLIAATAKDCSLMVTLRPLHNKHGVAFPLPSASLVTCPKTCQQYIFKINFIKLNIKRLEKMPFYHLFDQQIVNTYKECSKKHSNEPL